MACLPPRKCHIFRLCLLSVFVLSYIIGAMSTMHNNKHATAGFATVAAVLFIYLVMQFRVGYKSLNEQFDDELEKAANGQAGDNGYSTVSLKSDKINADRQTIIATAIADIPNRNFFRRNCAVVMVLGFVTMIMSLCGSLTYMYYAILNEQDYTMTSYWMAFMSFLMSAKWTFMCFWMGRKLRNEKIAFIAQQQAALLSQA